jgi:hypothetical protein
VFCLKAHSAYSLCIAALCCGLFLNTTTVFADTKENPNGIPNQSARSHAEGRSFDCFASLLVWTAREVGADCWAEVITSTGLESSNDLKQVHFDWDPGFRVGIGYGMEYDQWDTQLYFTWFHTSGHDQVSSTPGSVHSTFMGNFYVDNSKGAGISGPSYQSATIDWKIHFNMFDWELGRNFLVSKSLALRPLIGVKGGWIHQSIDSTWHNADLSGTEFYSKGEENLKNNFWGIGPSAGINMRWDLLTRPCHLFYLFGDFSGALMWGHWSFDDAFSNDIGQQVIVDLQDINSGASMVRTWMGFGWNTYFSDNRYSFSVRLGYETQFWLNQLQFYSFIGGRLDTTLTLQGGTLEFSFDF